MLRSLLRLSRPIHLLLADIVMPQMNGRRLAGKLTALRPGLRVLHMSGYSDDILGRRGCLDPGLALVRKPFTPTALVRAVRDALDAPGPESLTIAQGPANLIERSETQPPASTPPHRE